ncbi:MAG: hypothetical protein GY751_18920 [Bacteroidetes bacterium]|nr:hypothetical protein [Bacteroidota bacterium]
MLILYRCFPGFDFLNGHICSDWFIHYKSGFVRRGLMGTLFLLFGENALLTARTFLLGINLLLATLLAWHMWKRQFNILELAIVYLGPFGMLLYIFNGDYLLNKEIFSLVVFYWSLLILKGDHRSFLGNSFVLISSILAALNHEVFLFALLPALVLIAYNKRNSKLLSIQLASIGILMLILLFVFKGDPVIAERIYNGLPGNVQSAIAKGSEVFVPDYLADQYRKSKAISAIGWDLKTTLRMIFDMTFGLSIIVYLVFTFLLIRLLSMFYLDKRSLRYLMITSLFSVPLFFVAIDWGRWAFLVFHQVIAYRICFDQTDRKAGHWVAAIVLFVLYIPPSFTFRIWEESLLHNILNLINKVI